MAGSSFTHVLTACALGALLLSGCGDAGPVAPAADDGTPVLASGSVPSAAKIPNPSANARPIVIDLDDSDFETEQSAFFTETCGFPVSVDVDGFVLVVPVSSSPKAQRQLVEINVFHIEATFSNAEGETVRLFDVGPDILFLKDGQLHVAITGRSLTGSGVIGRVVINLETGEVVFQASREVGDFVENICNALG